MGDTRSREARSAPDFVREVASADDTLSRVAHEAIVAQEVARETAAANTTIAEQATEIAELKGRVDVLETEKAAAIAATESVQSDFDAYKAEQETAREIASRTDERVAKVKEVAPGLTIDAERASRYAAMSDEAFEFVLVDLEKAAALGPHAFKGDGDNCASCEKAKDASMHQAAEKAAAVTARETAMVGVTPQAPGAAASGSNHQSKLRGFVLADSGAN